MASPSAHSALVNVSSSTVLLAATPLLGLAVLSWHMGLELESPLIVGSIRTFIQLSILGAILHPIFSWGIDMWWIVLLYALFMVTLASFEASARSRYYFRGMVPCILGAFLVNVGLVSIFAFGLILKPSPLWDPQYVIPIIGMLLGNCVSGVSLAMNTILTILVENSSELDAYLAFGASPTEAASSALVESVRVGAMPMLNNMAVIGLISIPGMMTGQILAGSPVTEAAHYQMLIIYLIAMCTFGTILVEVFVVIRVTFDGQTQMLRSDRLMRRPQQRTFVSQIAQGIQSSCAWLVGRKTRQENGETVVMEGTSHETEPLPVSASDETYSSFDFKLSKGTLDISFMIRGCLNSESAKQQSPILDIRSVSRSIDTSNLSQNGLDKPLGASTPYRSLFSGVSVAILPGDIVRVGGASGVGKSQFLRIVAGLTPMDTTSIGTDEKQLSELLLFGQSFRDMANTAYWRRQVRYVTQTRIDFPGTPRQFIQRVSSLGAWGRQVPRKNHVTARYSGYDSMPTFDEMIATCAILLEKWRVKDPSMALDQTWKSLSGGEAQRIYLAIAVASGPRVLLLDEPTSALDMMSKRCVEETIQDIARDQGISILWVSHDEDQEGRMKANENIWEKS